MGGGSEGAVFLAHHGHDKVAGGRGRARICRLLHPDGSRGASAVGGRGGDAGCALAHGSHLARAGDRGHAGIGRAPIQEFIGGVGGGNRGRERRRLADFQRAGRGAEGNPGNLHSLGLFRHSDRAGRAFAVGCGGNRGGAFGHAPDHAVGDSGHAVVGGGPGHGSAGGSRSRQRDAGTHLHRGRRPVQRDFGVGVGRILQIQTHLLGGLFGEDLGVHQRFIERFAVGFLFGGKGVVRDAGQVAPGETGCAGGIFAAGDAQLIRKGPSGIPLEIRTGFITQRPQHESKIFAGSDGVAAAESRVVQAGGQLVGVGIAHIGLGPFRHVGKRHLPRAVDSFLFLAQQADQHSDGLSPGGGCFQIEIGGTVAVLPHALKQAQAVEAFGGLVGGRGGQSRRAQRKGQRAGR